MFFIILTTLSYSIFIDDEYTEKKNTLESLERFCNIS